MNVYRLEEALSQKTEIVIPLYEGQALPAEAAGALEGGLPEGLSLELGRTYHFVRGSGGLTTVLGLGEAEKMTLDRIRETGGRLAREAKEDRCILADTLACGKIGLEQAVYELAFGAAYGQYEFAKIGAEPKERPEISLASQEDAAAKEAALTAQCVNRARNLGNTPSNYMTPEALAKEAERLAEDLGVSCEILTNRELEELGAGAILGVNRGSSHEARLITLRYQGNGDAPFTALVGKGITFDAGGYNLKSASSMRGMKFDMCGGANVLGAFELIVRRKEKANVLAIVGATENKVGPDGYNCDDVLVSLSGRSIEITNTDAEGRLILCDAITYAQRQGAKRIVDMATLTGACITALGDRYTGAFSNSDAFFRELEKAAKEEGELVWRLPVDEEFRNTMKKSPVADLVNAVPGGSGGSCLAAAFLEEFVEEGVEWIHLDIAGPSETGKERPWAAGGATGVMIRTLAGMARG